MSVSSAKAGLSLSHEILRSGTGERSKRSRVSNKAPFVGLFSFPGCILLVPFKKMHSTSTIVV